MKKPALDPRSVNHSIRLTSADSERARLIAIAHDWPLGKVLAKLVALALDAKLLK